MKNDKWLISQRLTGLVPVSMTGEKLISLVIGKSTKPRCFKNIKKLSLPYEANSKAYVTLILFKKWKTRFSNKEKQ